jgi:pilus assembly protein FimV
MGLRTLAFVFGVATALSAQFAVALGLGGIKLNSALNQPLNAQIELLQVRDLSEQEILVGLASVDDFQRVGVDRSFFLSNLDFTIDLDAAGGPVILVTSKKPVREPFLNFVVEAQWPSGRLLREYTLLMDLPVFSEEQQVQPVQPTQEQPTRSARPAMPIKPATIEPLEEKPAAQTATVPRERSATEPAVPDDDHIYGPVKARDTLWEIAAASRPDNSISIQQTMLAIQRANPGAFINDNINLLRRGQVLRIPSEDEMTSLSRREAIAEVAYQNQRWSGGGDTTVEAPQLEGSKSYTSAETETTEPRGRVKLASPEDYSSSAEGRGTGHGVGSTEALENELAVTLEELDKSKSENTELKSRIASMEAQIETMERLVAVSSEEMRALQLAVTKVDQAENESAQPDQAKVEADSAAPTDKQDDSGDADANEPKFDAAGATPATEPESTETEKAQTATGAKPEDANGDQSKPAKDPAPTPQPVPEPKTPILDLILDNILFVVLGFVALIAAIALYLRARAKAADEDEFDGFLNEGTADEFQDIEGYDEERQSEESFDDLELEDEHEELLALEAHENHRTEQETEDAVAEADIYIALAKYEQAEEILLRALDKEPKDAHIRLKLLELYAAQQDLENFDPHFAKLRVLADDDINERAEELRGKIAGAPEFDETQFNSGATAASAVAATEETPVAEDDFLLDLDEHSSGSDHVAVAQPAEVEESPDDDFGDFDLELGEDFDDLAKDSASPIAAPAAESDDDLDFDFDLDNDTLAADEVSTGTNVEDIEDTEISADDLDFGEEFTLDFGIDEPEAEAEDEAPESDIDLGSMDLDLDSGFAAESETDENLEEEETDFDMDLGFNDELKADISATTSPAELAPSIEEQKDDSFLLDDLDSDFGEVDTLEDALDLKSPLAAAESADTEDDLDLDADMDLSALDEELDAMTAGLDTFFDEEPLAGEELSTDEEPSSDEEPLARKPSAAGEESFELEESREPDELEAEAGLPDTDFELHDIDPEAEDDNDLGFLSDSDETATKLDLARAYMDMGDTDGAKDILEEIIQEGNDEQRGEAQQLLERV